MGQYTIELSFSAANGEKVNEDLIAEVTRRSYAKGTFILNEGNMTNETGVLTYIDEKGIVIDSAYIRVNGTMLGNVCQDMFITGGKMYIISQNGSKNAEEGFLTIANSETLEKIKVYNSELSSLSWPSNIAVVGDKIYIRDNQGIKMLNATTDELTSVANTTGALKNRMAVVGDKVFVMTGSKKILVIQDGTVKSQISVDGTLTGIAKSYDNQLWVSYTSPSTIQKISVSDYSTIDTPHSLGSYAIGAGWGVSSAFSAVQDTLYFSNAGMKLCRHIFKENKTEEVANIQDYVADAKTYYNSLGVNPKTGHVYFATMKGFGADYKINDIAVFDFKKSSPLLFDYKKKNSFPAGVYFTYNFE